MADLLALFSEPMAFHFMRRALVVSVLLGVSGGLLGCVLLLRRMALMGDALAHSLLPGIGIAYLVLGGGVWSLFAGALIAGLLTALGSGLISRLTRVKEDAAFGALFVISFGLGIALLSLRGGEFGGDLLHFLFGNILGVRTEDLYIAAGASALTVVVFAVFHRTIIVEAFDSVFYRSTGRRGWAVHLGLLALIVVNLVAALQSMGVVLALGLFLLPAVTAYLWCERWGAMLLSSCAISVTGSLAGLLLSYHAGLPSGPAIVGVLGAGFLASALLSPRHGLTRGLFPPRHHTGESGEGECAIDGAGPRHSGIEHPHAHDHHHGGHSHS
jgi:zinc/manganese transport system permease protein